MTRVPRLVYRREDGQMDRLLSLLDDLRLLADLVEETKSTRPPSSTEAELLLIIAVMEIAARQIEAAQPPQEDDATE